MNFFGSSSIFPKKVAAVATTVSLLGGQNFQMIQAMDHELPVNLAPFTKTKSDHAGSDIFPQDENALSGPANTLQARREQVPYSDRLVPGNNGRSSFSPNAFKDKKSGGRAGQQVLSPQEHGRALQSTTPVPHHSRSTPGTSTASRDQAHQGASSSTTLSTQEESRSVLRYSTPKPTEVLPVYAEGLISSGGEGTLSVEDVGYLRTVCTQQADARSAATADGVTHIHRADKVLDGAGDMTLLFPGRDAIVKPGENYMCVLVKMPGDLCTTILGLNEKNGDMMHMVQSKETQYFQSLDGALTSVESMPRAAKSTDRLLTLKVAAGTNHGQVYCVDPFASRLSPEGTLRQFGQETLEVCDVSSVKLNPADARILAAAGDAVPDGYVDAKKQLRIYDARIGGPRAVLSSSRAVPGKTENVRSPLKVTDMAWNADGTMLATTGEGNAALGKEGVVCVWDLRNMQELRAQYDGTVQRAQDVIARELDPVEEEARGAFDWRPRGGLFSDAAMDAREEQERKIDAARDEIESAEREYAAGLERMQGGNVAGLRPAMQSEAHGADPTSVAWIPSRAGEIQRDSLATAGLDGQVKVWDLSASSGASTRRMNAKQTVQLPAGVNKLETLGDPKDPRKSLLVAGLDGRPRETELDGTPLEAVPSVVVLGEKKSLVDHKNGNDKEQKYETTMAIHPHAHAAGSDPEIVAGREGAAPHVDPAASQLAVGPDGSMVWITNPGDRIAIHKHNSMGADDEKVEQKRFKASKLNKFGGKGINRL